MVIPTTTDPRHQVRGLSRPKAPSRSVRASCRGRPCACPLGAPTWAWVVDMTLTGSLLSAPGIVWYGCAIPRGPAEPAPFPRDPPKTGRGAHCICDCRPHRRNPVFSAAHSVTTPKPTTGRGRPHSHPNQRWAEALPTCRSAAGCLVWVLAGLLAVAQPAGAGSLLSTGPRRRPPDLLPGQRPFCPDPTKTTPTGPGCRGFRGPGPGGFGCGAAVASQTERRCRESAHLPAALGFRRPRGGRVQLRLFGHPTHVHPRGHQRPAAPPGQRPYAGWLGIDFSLHTKDAHALNSVELALGTTGPDALAEQTQDLVHDLRGFAKFEGWSSQSQRTHAQSVLQAEAAPGPGNRVRQFRRGRLRGVAGGPGQLPGVRSRGHPAALRVEPAQVDFPDPRLSVTAYTLQPFITQRRQQHPWSVYGLAGAMGAAVAYNITLDGPVFQIGAKHPANLLWANCMPASASATAVWISVTSTRSASGIQRPGKAPAFRVAGRDLPVLNTAR